jgi:hypothetical protein
MRHAGVARFLIITVVTIGHGYDPLKTLLASFLAAPGALFGVPEGNVGWHALPLIGVASLFPRAR